MNYLQGLLVVALVATCLAFVVQVEAGIPKECDNMALIMEPEHEDFVSKCQYACSTEGWQFVSSVKPKYDYSASRIRCCCAYIEGSEDWIEKQEKLKAKKSKKGIWGRK